VLAPSHGLSGDARSGDRDDRGSEGARLFNFAHFGDSVGFAGDYWRVERVIVRAMARFLLVCWQGFAAGGEKCVGMLM
jgi:hypothetical protein